MTGFGARIRRVRMRDGADVSILPTPMLNKLGDEPENWRGKLIANAKGIADQGSPDSKLDGFIIIGLFDDGANSIGFRLPERVPTSLWPAYVAEILRRDIVTEREAERVFDDKFQWVE